MATVLRPSAAGRWTRCTGSVALCDGLPERPAGQPAKDGTACHALAELCLTNGEVSADDYLGEQGETPAGKEAEFPDGLPIWNADMIEAANLYLDTVYSVLRPEYWLFVEQKAVAVPLTKGPAGEFMSEGTTDAAIYIPDRKHLYVFDLKFGYGIVEPEDNRQLATYTLGIIRFLKDVHGVDVASATWTIVQPRASHPSGPVRSKELNAFDLWDLDALISGSIAKIAAGETELVSGSHCDWCDAQFADVCPKRKEEFKTAFSQIILPDVIADLDADEMGARLDQADAIESYIADLRTRAEAMASTGKLPKGRKFVAGQGKREWAVEPEVAAKAIAAETGKDIAEQKITYMTLPQAEKLVGKKAFAEALVNIQENAKLKLAAYKPGKPKLVPESAPGDAIDITASSGAFSPILQPA